MPAEDTFGSQLLELRRGVIVLAILSQLRTPRYGYGLLQQLEYARVAVDAGTLYPLLRRLERQGVLESVWDTSEVRPRKYYQLTDSGEKLYVDLVSEWQVLTKSIEAMIEEGYEIN